MPIEKIEIIVPASPNGHSATLSATIGQRAPQQFSNLLNEGGVYRASIPISESEQQGVLTSVVRVGMSELNVRDCEVARIKTDPTLSIESTGSGMAKVEIPDDVVDRYPRPKCSIQILTDPDSLKNQQPPVITGLSGECTIGNPCPLDDDIKLALVPSSPQGYTFVGWDNQSPCHGSTKCVISCDFPAKLTAKFKSTRCDSGTWCQDQTIQSARGLWGDSTSDGDDYWVAGTGGLIAHKAPGQFPRYYGGADDTTLRSIWGLSPKNIWAVGENGRVFHFEGTSWIPETVSDKPLDSSSFYAVSGNESGEVWIVGSDGLAFQRPKNGDWQQKTLPPGAAPPRLYAVWVAPPNWGNRVIVAGQVGYGSGKDAEPYLREWNGSDWAKLPVGDGSEVTAWRAIYGTNVNGTFALWLGGVASSRAMPTNNIVSLQRKSLSWPPAKADEANWSLCGSSAISINALWGKPGSDSEVWAVGDGATICKLSLTGSAPESTSLPDLSSAGSLWSIWGNGKNDAILSAGDDGLFHRVVAGGLRSGVAPSFLPLLPSR